MNNSEQTRIAYSTFDVANGDKVVTMSLEDAEWLVSLAVNALNDSNYHVQQNRQQLEILRDELRNEK